MTVNDKQKKKRAKSYEKYVKNFTPKPAYIFNMVKAFIIGGMICTVSMFAKNKIIGYGIGEEMAGTCISVGLIMIAQLLTGLGIFDTIGKFAGAGVIVPITGFANAMVATAIEFKKEGPVLGAGAKMFNVAGPVLVCGITVSSLIGVIYWAVGVLS